MTRALLYRFGVAIASEPQADSTLLAPMTAIATLPGVWVFLRCGLAVLSRATLD